MLVSAGIYWGIGQLQVKEYQSEISDLKSMVIEDESIPLSDSLYQSPYQNVFEQNKDMVAWLNIPNTRIDYPVLQTKDDEEYYLKKDFYGEENKNGSLLMAVTSDLDNKRSVILIHGHNMKSGEMFGELDQYTQKEYWEQNKNIILYTKNDERKYEIFAALYGKVLSEEEEGFRYYQYINNTDIEKMKEFQKYLEEKNIYQTDSTIELNDEIIILSTCSGIGKEGRFVVIGKRIN